MTIKTKPAIAFRKLYSPEFQKHTLIASFELEGKEWHIREYWLDERNYDGLEEETRQSITRQIEGFNGKLPEYWQCVTYDEYGDRIIMPVPEGYQSETVEINGEHYPIEFTSCAKQAVWSVPRIEGKVSEGDEILRQGAINENS